MLVRDIMTSSVIGIAPTDTIDKAMSVMLSRGVSGLPVIAEDGALLGMLTEGDLLRRSELETEPSHSWLGELLRSPGRAAAEYVHTHSHHVADVMTDEPVTIAPDASLREAVDVMSSRRVKRLPVVEDGRVVGILSRADVLRALLRTVPREPGAATDAEIEQEIVAEFQRQAKWAGEDFVHVSVQNGVVELTGTIMDERLRTAARVAAENTRGVVAVEDHLVAVQPMTDAAMPMSI